MAHLIILKRLFSSTSLAKRKSLRNIFPLNGSEKQLVKEPPFKIWACCSAEAFNMDKLFLHAKASLDVFPVQISGVLVAKDKNDDILYFFESGSIVAWSSQRGAVPDSRKLMQIVTEYRINPLETQETEVLDYLLTKEEPSHSRSDDTIIIESNSEEMMLRERLAFSNGIADSVKLASLESAMEDLIKRVTIFPKTLKSGKQMNLNSKEVLKLQGELLSIRAAVNLQSRLIDPPDLYWSEPHLETLYHQTTRALENKQRISIMNAKIDYVGELQGILANHLNTKHSTNLELGIIGLIMIEVVFECIHFFS